MDDEMENQQVYEQPQPSEKDSLIAEKIRLATELGIWEAFNPAPGFEDTPQYQRIKEIDERLAVIG